MSGLASDLSAHLNISFIFAGIGKVTLDIGCRCYGQLVGLQFNISFYSISNGDFTCTAYNVATDMPVNTRGSDSEYEVATP